VRRVGLYVPGGLAPLLSSVVMNVVPAQIAGVESIAVASPPQRDHGGLPDPGVLAACALLGVTEVYAVGGAQAIAVFGYGAGSCEPVDMVTGPGNVYVTAAKRLLRGLIGIDSEAGPTEVAILADDTADPVHVAADLISQAEHDPLAGAVLVTDQRGAGRRRPGPGAGQVAATKHSDRITTALDGQPVGHRAGGRRRRRACGWSTPTPPSTWRSRRGTPARWRCGCATPARSSSGHGRRCRWATTAPGPTTCCRPAGARGTPAA
jgi:histidinol dehydrogenase